MWDSVFSSSVCYSLTTLVAVRNDVQSGSLLGDYFPGKCRSFSELLMNMCKERLEADEDLWSAVGSSDFPRLCTYSRGKFINAADFDFAKHFCDESKELSVIFITFLVILSLFQRDEMHCK